MTQGNLDARDIPDAPAGHPVHTFLEENKVFTNAVGDMDLIDLDTGRMAADQVNLMLKHLPLDVAFVDENDRIRYFSASKEPIFERNPDIIGTTVQECHPPEILDEVNRLIGDFKAGAKDEAVFWVRVRGRLIYNRYFAVRDDEGIYRGIMEVSQDITDIKSIEGERGH